MLDWSVSTDQVVFGLIAFAAGVLVSSIVVGALLVLISPDHFVAPKDALRRRIRSAPLRVAAVVGKNLLGVVLVAAGVLLSVPGVPGQGLLTILVGLVLLDLPGKRKLELKLVSRPKVLAAINRLRRRFGRAPLQTQPELPSQPDG
jgi:hypothetical protein